MSLTQEFLSITTMINVLQKQKKKQITDREKTVHLSFAIAIKKVSTLQLSLHTCCCYRHVKTHPPGADSSDYLVRRIWLLLL